MKARLPKGMGGGPQNMNQIIKQAQKMQDDIKDMQEVLEAREYTGNSGSGLVEAVVTGKFDVVSVKINPSAVDTDDLEMLEDLIAAAVNDAITKARTESDTEMAKITDGVSVPGMF